MLWIPHQCCCFKHCVNCLFEIRAYFSEGSLSLISLFLKIFESFNQLICFIIHTHNYTLADEFLFKFKEKDIICSYDSQTVNFLTEGYTFRLELSLNVATFNSIKVKHLKLFWSHHINLIFITSVQNQDRNIVCTPDNIVRYA